MVRDAGHLVVGKPPVNLTDALKTLSDAHGSKALAAAFAAVQGQVRRARRAADKGLGPLAQTFIAAMRIWDQQKADGVRKAERLAGLEKTLRAAWPQADDPGRLYRCRECWDIGAIACECPGNDHCGRHKPHLAHSYIAPCFCPKGEKFKEKPKPGPEDFTAAGKSKPMTRMGR
jgi:hypothetical protein